MKLESDLAGTVKNVESLTAHKQCLVHELAIAKASAEDERNNVECYTRDLY